MAEGGTLYLCATPIGNLADITLRVLQTLREADLIAAEDTRRTRKLLSHYHIHTPLTSYHRHNYKKKREYLLGLLGSGKNIALVSDAGLPGIADPGAELVPAVLEAGCRVVPLPGPSAAVTALAASGLPADRFFFAGFLPAAMKARREKLREFRSQGSTLVFYEAPHRLRASLADLKTVLGNRPAAVARELTKVHEEIIRGPLEEIMEHFARHEPRGEFTLVVAGAPPGQAAGPEEEKEGWRALAPAAHVALLEAGGTGRKEAMREVARLRGLSRRDVYRAVLSRQDEGPDGPAKE